MMIRTSLFRKWLLQVSICAVVASLLADGPAPIADELRVALVQKAKIGILLREPKIFSEMLGETQVERSEDEFCITFVVPFDTGRKRALILVYLNATTLEYARHTWK